MSDWLIWAYGTIGGTTASVSLPLTPIMPPPSDPQEQVREFKSMVKALHKANLEVILDVVYNHTAEGNHFGPMLSYKGLDNRHYYRLVDGDEQFYMDYTGTGNTVDMTSPRTLQMVMDSLRYWGHRNARRRIPL